MKVIVHIHGGVLQGVYSDQKDLDFTLYDFDELYEATPEEVKIAEEEFENARKGLHEIIEICGL
jgi:hypothetical protein